MVKLHPTISCIMNAYQQHTKNHDGTRRRPYMTLVDDARQSATNSSNDTNKSKRHKRHYSPTFITSNSSKTTSHSQQEYRQPAPSKRRKAPISSNDHHKKPSSTPYYRMEPSYHPYRIEPVPSYHYCYHHDVPQPSRRFFSPSIMVGPPSLGIFRLRLPPHLLHLLDYIVEGCERHAANLPEGWHTNLYSLTKQDLALSDNPLLYHMAQPIVSFIQECMRHLWCLLELPHLDQNQPHVLKYSCDRPSTKSSRGVELHHDKCDITANLCLSRSSSYTGGGTWFPDAGETVRLSLGEFLLHPGPLVHAGKEITSGTRHLMILFANTTSSRRR